MLDSGFMPLFHLCSSDRNMTGGGCAVATREKTAVLLSTNENHCLHYVLFLMQLDRKSTRLNSSHITRSRMPSSA